VTNPLDSEFQERMHRRFDALFGDGTLATRFQGAKPFPYLVIDDFLDPEIASWVADRFPPLGAPLWMKLPTEDQRLKSATIDEGLIPQPARRVLQELTSGTSSPS
jgi:hypothetical protein